MKTAAGLIAVSLLLAHFAPAPAPQEVRADDLSALREAVAGVKEAAVSIELRDGLDAALSYRTISAKHEIPRNPGMSDDPEGVALYEQIMSQRLMKARLVLDTAVEIAGIPFEAGRYGVGLSGFKDGNFDLAIFKDRERFKFPIVMNTAPFESPYIAFSFASLSRTELALVLHGGRKCGCVKIKVLGKKKGEPGGAESGGDLEGGGQEGGGQERGGQEGGGGGR